MGKRIVKLITRFVGNRCVVFDGSRAYYWNVPMVLFPMDAFSFLQKELESQFGHEARDSFFYLGKIQGSNGCNILIQKFKFVPDVKDISFFIEQTEFVGIGKTRIVLNDLKNSHMIFSMVFSPNATAYFTEFGKQHHAVCDYVRGLYAGAIEAISKAAVANEEQLIAIETKCVAKGDPSCIIEIQKASAWRKSEIKQEYPKSTLAIEEVRKVETLAKLLRIYLKPAKNPDTQLNSFLRSKNLKRPFTFNEDGSIELIGMDVLITPIDILVLLFRLYEKKGAKAFYAAGSFLGKTSTDRIIKSYALDKRRLDVQKMMFDQVGLFGLGKIELARISTDGTEYTFYLYNSPGDHYKDLFGISSSKTDYFVAGIINGILEYLFDKKFETVEKACVVNGSSYCIFSSCLVSKRRKAQD